MSDINQEFVPFSCNKFSCYLIFKHEKLRMKHFKYPIMTLQFWCMTNTLHIAWHPHYHLSSWVFIFQSVISAQVPSCPNFWLSSSLARMKNQWMPHKTTRQDTVQVQQLKDEKPRMSKVHRLLDDISFHFMKTKTDISFIIQTKWNLHVHRPSHERKKQLFTCSLFMVASVLVFLHPPTTTFHLIWEQVEKPRGISEFVQHFSSSSSSMSWSRRMYSLTRIHFSTNFSQFSHSVDLTYFSVCREWNNITVNEKKRKHEKFIIITKEKKITSKWICFIFFPPFAYYFFHLV